MRSSAIRRGPQNPVFRINVLDNYSHLIDFLVKRIFTGGLQPPPTPAPPLNVSADKSWSDFSYRSAHRCSITRKTSSCWWGPQSIAIAPNVASIQSAYIFSVGLMWSRPRIMWSSKWSFCCAISAKTELVMTIWTPTCSWRRFWDTWLVPLSSKYRAIAYLNAESPTKASGN